jgi:hypothetical protein
MTIINASNKTLYIRGFRFNQLVPPTESINWAEVDPTDVILCEDDNVVFEGVNAAGRDVHSFFDVARPRSPGDRIPELKMATVYTEEA